MSSSNPAEARIQRLVSAIEHGLDAAALATTAHESFAAAEASRLMPEPTSGYRHSEPEPVMDSRFWLGASAIQGPWNPQLLQQAFDANPGARESGLLASMLAANPSLSGRPMVYALTRAIVSHAPKPSGSLANMTVRAILAALRRQAVPTEEIGALLGQGSHLWNVRQNDDTAIDSDLRNAIQRVESTWMEGGDIRAIAQATAATGGEDLVGAFLLLHPRCDAATAGLIRTTTVSLRSLSGFLEWKRWSRNAVIQSHSGDMLGIKLPDLQPDPEVKKLRAEVAREVLCELTNSKSDCHIIELWESAFIEMLHTSRAADLEPFLTDWLPRSLTFPSRRSAATALERFTEHYQDGTSASMDPRWFRPFLTHDDAKVRLAATRLLGRASHGRQTPGDAVELSALTR